MRSIMPLGDEGAVVLMFDCPGLVQRHQQLHDIGASWDYPEYQPHVTVSYDGAPDDLSAVQPYQGDLVFGPEQLAEINDDWQDNREEREVTKVIHARDRSRASAPRTWPRPETDAGRRAALDREARQLLRAHRAQRVEADLRSAAG
jgi:hypothetical protein